jgi:hypothetical protein
MEIINFSMKNIKNYTAKAHILGMDIHVGMKTGVKWPLIILK